MLFFFKHLFGKVFGKQSLTGNKQHFIAICGSGLVAIVLKKVEVSEAHRERKDVMT